MVKNLNLFSKVVIVLFLIFILMINYSPKVSHALSQDDQLQSGIVLLEEKINKKDIQEIEKEFPEIKLDYIEEIDTLHVKGINNSNSSSFKNFTQETLEIDSFDILSDSIVSLPEIHQTSTIETSSINLKNENIQDNSTYRNWMWNIKQVTDNYQSYSINKGSHNVKIGIIDSGVDFSHPDLMENIVDEGESFIPGDNSTRDSYGHGTMVAGIIAANGNIMGVGPELGIVPYRVFDSSGEAYSSWVIKAIIEAVNDDMDVINLSLSTFKSMKEKDDREIVKAFKRAFKYARKNNTLIVASAGNHGLDIGNAKNLAMQLGTQSDIIVHLPGGAKDVITVSATTRENTLASYSNYGKNITIAAPGGDYGPDWVEKSKIDLNSLILTTYPTNMQQSRIVELLGFEEGYEFSMGTSMAAPKVAATAALIKAEYHDKFKREMPNHKVEKILYKNVDKFMNHQYHLFGSGTV